jgi:hypothetical protein
MLDLSRPPDCEYGVQHLIGSYDAMHPSSNPNSSQTSFTEEANSLRRLLHGHIRCHLRNPFQVL